MRFHNNLKTINFGDPITFEAYGVQILIDCNDPELGKKIRKLLPSVIPENLHLTEDEKYEHIFTIKKENDENISIDRNGEDHFTFTYEDRLLDNLSTRIRITVAEFAKSKVFLHAGAVGWKNFGIIIPGKSYSGKTTLVSELIKIGAEYYSDEYAVLDERGFLQPYPKTLSMRGILNEWDQVEIAPEKFGAAIGKKAIPVGMVLIAEYREKAKWRPKTLSSGEGLMEILQHTIPIRHNPDFVLKVLKKMTGRAIIAKSKRGAANEFAPFFLEYLDKTLFNI